MADGPTQGGDFGFGPGESPGPGGGPAEVDISPGSYDESVSLGVGSGLESSNPGLGQSGPGTGGSAGESDTQTLQEFRAGFTPEPGVGFFNLGQDLVQTIQEATGVTVPDLVAGLPLARSLFNLPPHHKEKNRLENLLGESSPAYNAAYREIARVAAGLMERMPTTAASILAHRQVNDRIEAGSFNPVVERRPEDTNLDRLLARAGAVRLSNATDVPRADGSDRGFRDEQGRLVPADQAMRNLAEVAARGGALGSNQRAIVRAMTPAERRAYGIFLRPDGTVRSLPETVGAAFINLSAGQPLSANQQAAVGATFNAIPTAAGRRDAIAQLSLATGVDRTAISQAVGPSMRVAADNAKAASPATDRVTRQQILAVVGRDLALNTRNGKPVSVAMVVDNALRNIENGRPMTENQKAVLIAYRAATGSEYGKKLDSGRRRSEKIEDRRRLPLSPILQEIALLPSFPMPIVRLDQMIQRDTRLSRSVREYAKRLLAHPPPVREGSGEPLLPLPALKTKSGQTRTAAQVLRNAAENKAAGRPLTANQKKVVKQLLAERNTQAQKQAKAQPKPVPKPVQQARPAPRPAPKPVPPVYKTTTGQVRTQAQVLQNAAQNRAAGRPLTANQKAAVSAVKAPARVVAPRPVPRPAAAPPRPAPKPAPKPTYTTKTGQTRTQAEVLKNAAQNRAAGRPLTENQKKALKAQQKAKK